MADNEGHFGNAGADRIGARPRTRSWWPFARRPGRALDPGRARLRIVIWAILIAAVSAAIDLPRPLDDSYRLMREVIRPHKADGQTVVIAIDDRSLTELGVRDPLRGDDAKLLDRLFDSGVRKVVFDRAYADPSTAAEDGKLIASLKRHRGRVFIGSTPQTDFGFSTNEQILTHPRFLGAAPMVTMLAYEGPFTLSWRLATSSVIKGEKRPSISAVLSNTGGTETFFRPDFSIRVSDIPTYSYVDVLKGRVSADKLAGRDVIIGPANIFSPDRYRMPFIGVILGSQIHAIGAQTLRERFPIDLGAGPALVIVGVFLVWQARRRAFSKRKAVLVAAGLAAAPALLDVVSVNLDTMAALAGLLIGSVRLNALARTTYRGDTDMLRIEHLHSSEDARDCDVIALKIRNFATISALLSPREIERLLVKLQERLRVSEGTSQFAFDKDTVVWLREKMQPDEREGHLRGLHALFRTSIAVGEESPDVAVAIGLETNYTRPLRERTEGAIQTAEDAAHAGKLFLVGEGEEEDRSWQLRFFSELATAIDLGDFTVQYQPKVDLASGAIVGAEALLRWDHPVRGLIDPAKIVAFAEEHNRIDVITRFVLERSIVEARKAIAIDPDFKVAVNISALDLRDPDFARDVAKLLTRFDYPANNLILEITETAPIESDRDAGALLQQLKQLGVRLSVDDFGTGHASLHYLRQIPSHEVKIDRSFVSSMCESREDYTLVRTAIEMIHSLGRIAVAEGVETEEVARLLGEMGCDKGQGYYFSKAIPMETLLSKLTKGALAA